MKKKICLIYTGGTIGMVPSGNGYVPSGRDFREYFPSIPDLLKPGMPELEVIQFDPLLDSSNIAVREWNRIGGLRELADSPAIEEAQKMLVCPVCGGADAARENGPGTR